MREVKAFPHLPATQAGTFISFDKKSPRADFHISVFTASISLSMEEKASRECEGMIPRGTHAVLLPHCPCCLQWSSQTPVLLDPMSKILPSRSFHHALGDILHRSILAPPSDGSGCLRTDGLTPWQTACQRGWFQVTSPFQPWSHTPIISHPSDPRRKNSHF